MNKITNLRFQEYYNKTIALDAVTKFNYINNHQKSNIKKIILNFSFKQIDFNKKKIIPFFMALELITGQKAFLTRSKKLTMGLKIRKGDIVGCKVTLQHKQLYQFYDYLMLALNRSENFKPFDINQLQKKRHTFSFHLKDLFNFYQVELDLNPIIEEIDITILYNTNNKEEKIFLTSAYKLPITN